MLEFKFNDANEDEIISDIGTSAEDVTEAKRFLQLLDPKALEFNFQTIFEAGSKGPVREQSGTFDDASWLSSQNDRGCGVFVCVNEVKGKRNAANVQRIRAVWQEDDDGWEGAFPLPPSIVVQTSPGRHHRYWLVEGDWPADDQGRADFSAVMKGMIANHGSDPIAKDLSRLLRLPGFNHMKEQPRLVRMLEANGRRYTRNEIVKAFAVQDPSTFKKSGTSGDGVGPNNFKDGSLRRVKEAINVIPADERENWLHVGMGIHHKYYGSQDTKAAFELWCFWSKSSKKYKGEQDQRRHWNSFGEKANPITIATVFRLAKEHGWSDTEAVELNSDVPRSKGVKSGDLTERTMASVRKRFDEIDHRPSPAQFQALQDLACNLEALANGTATVNSVCAIDPGIGKTTVDLHFIKHLLESPDHNHVSVLLLVRTYNEIETLLQEMGLKDHEFAIVVSDTGETCSRLNNIGNPDKTRARILITTHSMYESRIKRAGGSFRAVKEFHYDGKRRNVRIWDEACLPARPITLRATLIDRMKDVASKLSPELHGLLKVLTAEIDAIAKKGGGFVDIPNFSASGVDEFAVREIFRDEKRYLRHAVNDLYLIEGKTVEVIRHGKVGTCVHYENTLPDDFKPAVICDASARVRQTYPLWAEGRGDLVFLQDAPKNYSNALFHVWRQAGSKSAWQRHYERLLEGIASTINAKSETADWLIFYHNDITIFDLKKDKRVPLDIPLRLRKKVRNPDRLKFVHWGSEDSRATNKHRDIQNIMLAGTLFFDEPTYHCFTRLSLGLPSDKPLSQEHLRRIKHGEHANVILQAVCRGAMRKSVGDGCGRCDVYIIADPRSGIPQKIENGSIFPGARVVDWTGVETKLTGKVAEAIKIIDTEVVAKRTTMTVPELRCAMANPSASNFRKAILQHRHFLSALAQRGVELVPGKGSRAGVLRLMV
jgi:hypothetical protein